MKKLISTLNMPREEWLKERRKGVCGSESSIILGLNPYKSILALWQEKTNRVPVEEKENSYTYFGHVMEPVIKKEFTKRTGLKVRAVNYILQSHEYEWMLADIDGIVKEKDGSYSLFEAKTATEFKREIWEHSVPKEYYAQVQHYLAVTGFKKAYVAGIVGGNSYYCHEIFPDEEYIHNLIQCEKKFWDCVVNDIKPTPDSSKATSEFLNEQYSCANNTEIELPENAKELVESYKALDEEIGLLNEKKEGITNILKSLLQENEKGVIGDHIVSWKMFARKSLNTKKVKELLGSTYDEYVSESTYRRFSVA